MNEDYTLPSGNRVLFFLDPTPVNITLLNDGVAEGLETIFLTLKLIQGPIDDNFILEHSTAVINLQDIDGISLQSYFNTKCG